MKEEKYPQNSVRLIMPSLPQKKMRASMISAFVSQLNPTLEELADIKCACQGGTNCIVPRIREYLRDDTA